ncbi:hypothetical protein CDL12_10851 [Handroanthus impetiginosus]|uniref:Uncharacterized protein n=1 Tax=Handroanthus impetiginosus TaxID=429701 RepID=A0A2G9HG84_9LAMI|nr:hypothetical protein CDL12_10851 [Handroanthus impetiginosus]
MEREPVEEADERREAAIASAISLRPNFKPKKGLTEAQLSKFQELQKRRLQIKARSKAQNKYKGLGDGKNKSHKKANEVHDSTDQEPSKPVENPFSISIPENRVGNTSSVEEDNVATNLAAKKRRKLFWGLDTKERWERKSNM